MQHLIIGAGPAGVVAAETLRKADPDADIAIIGDEPEPPYSRMAIPYYLIDNIDESGTYLRDPKQHFASLDIEVVQQRVDKIDTTGKTVALADGSSRSYDKLLLATGSHPVSPPIPGAPAPPSGAATSASLTRSRCATAISRAPIRRIGAAAAISASAAWAS